MTNILEVKNLSKSFGGIIANKNISFEANSGEIIGIIGPNGAGKSTAMKAMLGMLNLHQGKVTFNDTDISNLSPPESSPANCFLFSFSIGNNL